MPHLPPRARWFATGAALLSTLMIVSPVTAQDGTPVTGEGIPGSECNAPARPADFLGTLVATPISDEPYVAPTAVPDGTAVEEPAASEVEAAVRMYVACSNSGEVLRALSLLSDEYLRRVVDPTGELDSDTAVELGASLATPIAIEPDQYVRLLGIRQMVQLPDGRVAVVVETDGGPVDPEGTDVDLLIFEKIGESWIIVDAVNDIDDLEAAAASS